MSILKKPQLKPTIAYLKEARVLNLLQYGTIGIMGGSFNPPHLGHLKIAELSINKLNLNKLLWLVTPQNPLKSNNNLLPFKQRILLCKQLTKNNPKIKVSGIEQSLGSTYTYNTIVSLKKLLNPNINLILILGEDVWYNFDMFYKWQELAKIIPIFIVARDINHTSTASFSTLLQKAPQMLKAYYTPDITKLITTKPPIWGLHLIPKLNISSTHIRATTENLNHE